MTNEQKMQICRMRQKNQSYVSIASALGVTVSMVKGYCHRNGLEGMRAGRHTSSDADEVVICPECGKEIIQRNGIKKLRFCSSACRQAWWNRHPEKVNRKAVYTFVCRYCGQSFSAYGNAYRKYCSHACYIANRYQEVQTNGSLHV